MSDAINGLIELNDRWPKFFEFIRAMNGYETSLTEEQMDEISQKIDSDTAGVEIFTRSMILLTTPPGVSEFERNWLRNNGFIHKKTVDYGNRLAELEEQLEHEWMSEKEKAAIREEVTEIMVDIRKMAEDSSIQLQRGFSNLQNSLEN